MSRLLQVALLAFGPAYAQVLEDANELLNRARSTAAGIHNWRAEVVERAKISGAGMNHEGEVRTELAVLAPSRLRRQHRGEEKTILVCDGVNTFYSVDGHSFSRGAGGKDRHRTSSEAGTARELGRALDLSEEVAKQESLPEPRPFHGA